jgi:1-phosphofructokinase
MTAALAVGLATGMGVEETLRLAAAAGAINVTRRGLGTGTQREIRDLTDLITVRTRVFQPNS